MTAMQSLPPHLARIVDAEIPRFSDAEMARRRAAVEVLLAEHDCDHLIFCGLNRFGSAVQWLTQWPVTAEAVGVLTPGKRDALFVQWVNHAPQALARCRQGGRRLGRRIVDWLRDRGARQTRLAQRPHRLYRAADRGAAYAALRALSEHRQSHARLHQAAAGEVGGGTRLASHRRALHRSRHGGAARRVEAGIERARIGRPGRARLHRARRDQCHSLHRRHLDEYARPRRAAAVCHPRGACRRATRW